ncbi:MAG TPA: acyl carrier protein [Thermoanaerobaculia bacterium]|nr:acyl carrier protein [Thermoanaerobaculia bacterium]
MNDGAIVDLIVETVEGYRVSTGGEGGPVARETALFGPSGALDSLGLVSVLVELEQKVADRLGRTVSLMDDRAMSQASSPFRTVGSLADYLGAQLSGGASGR